MQRKKWTIQFQRDSECTIGWFLHHHNVSSSLTEMMCCTWKDFMLRTRNHEAVIAYFNTLKLDVSDARTLFKLLDRRLVAMADLCEGLTSLTESDGLQWPWARGCVPKHLDLMGLAHLVHQHQVLAASCEEQSCPKTLLRKRVCHFLMVLCFGLLLKDPKGNHWFGWLPSDIPEFC